MGREKRNGRGNKGWKGEGGRGGEGKGCVMDLGGWTPLNVF